MTLRDDQQARIEKLVRQGAYPDPAAVLDDALALAERKAKFQALVQEGVDAVKRGEIVDHDTVFRAVRQRIAEIAAEKQSAAAVE
jgi:predicted transcriptional regulator